MARGVVIGAPNDADLLHQLTRLEERLGPMPVGAATSAAERARRILPGGPAVAGDAGADRRYAFYTQLAGVLGRAPHELFRAAPGELGGRDADIGRVFAAAGRDERAERMVADALGDGVDLGALSAGQMKQALAAGTALIEPLAVAAAASAGEHVAVVVADQIADERLTNVDSAEARALTDQLRRLADARARRALAERRRAELCRELRSHLPRTVDGWIEHLASLDVGAESATNAFIGVAAALYAHRQAASGAFVATGVADTITATSAAIELGYFASLAVAHDVYDGRVPPARAPVAARPLFLGRA